MDKLTTCTPSIMPGSASPVRHSAVLMGMCLATSDRSGLSSNRTESFRKRRLVKVYEEQARALVEAGADAVIIETQTSLEELGLAVEAARAAGAPCVIASLAYDLSADKTFYVTMMGVLPGDAARNLEEKGAHIIALNCGTGMEMSGAAAVVELYRKSCTLPTMVQPNAGLPVLERGKAVYKQLPEDMAGGVPKVLQAGANIIGSCCGSTPEHTRAIRRMVSEYNLSMTKNPK